MEIRHESSSGFKYFTILATIVSLFVVNLVFLHDPWYHPEDYPRHFGLFFTLLYSFLFIMWSWAYIVTISSTRLPPKSATVRAK